MCAQAEWASTTNLANVDLGEDLACVFSHESHEFHESFARVDNYGGGLGLCFFNHGRDGTDGRLGLGLLKLGEGLPRILRMGLGLRAERS